MKDILIKLLGLLGIGSVSGGLGAGLSASGADWWQIALSVLGVIGVGGIGTGLATKLQSIRKFAQEVSEALVAVGLCGVTATVALEDGDWSPEERKEAIAKFKAIGTEFSDVCKAATDMVKKFKG